MSRILHCLVGSALAFGLIAQSTVNNGAQQPGPELTAVSNELLVQFQPGATANRKAVARARVRAEAIEVVAEARAGRGDLELVRIPPGLAVAEAVRGISGDAAVTFAEPNWLYTRGQTISDPY
jgi:hypothetical protein